MPETPEVEEPTKKKRGKLKVIIPALILVLGIGGGAFFMLGSGGKKAAADGKATTTTTIPGPVVVLDPITTNLSDGHVLKVGLSLRMAAKPKNKKLATIVAGLASATASTDSSSTGTSSPLDGEESVALDLAITVLGDDSFASLSSPDGKAAAKATLTQQIEAAYGGDVTDVYYNDFVMS